MQIDDGPILFGRLKGYSRNVNTNALDTAEGYHENKKP